MFICQLGDTAYQSRFPVIGDLPSSKLNVKVITDALAGRIIKKIASSKKGLIIIDALNK